MCSVPSKIISAVLFIWTFLSSVSATSMKPLRSEHWKDFNFVLPVRLLQYVARKVCVPPVTGSSFVPLHGQKYRDSKSKPAIADAAVTSTPLIEVCDWYKAV